MSRPAASAFDELPLDPVLLKTLADNGVTTPFPIQAATLPDSLQGRDVLGRGRTGSGKTLSFGLPLLHRTAGKRAEPRRPLALVLVPTRELAQQVTDALTPYAERLGLRTATVMGGVSITRQIGVLRRGAEVLVATPGRLKDLIDRDACALDRVSISVLDEADHMADMGFLPQVTGLLAQVPPGGQHMLFSATLDNNVDKLVRRFLTDPVTHSVDAPAATVTTMSHHVLQVLPEDKKAVTSRIAAREGRLIMFVGTKRGADRTVKQLLAAGVHAAALHGGKSQPQRNRVLEQFRTGQVTALVATDVAARGIHIDGLDLVVNVDPPTEAKDYLHRGGRTARAGETGSVVTLVLPEQRREVGRLMREAGIRLETERRVRPGDAELAEVTGAREPSGVAVVVPVPAQEQPQPSASGGRRRNRRGGRGGSGGSGGTAAPGAGSGSGSGGGRGRDSGRDAPPAATAPVAARPAAGTGPAAARPAAAPPAAGSSGRGRSAPGRHAPRTGGRRAPGGPAAPAAGAARAPRATASSGRAAAPAAAAAPARADGPPALTARPR
ncbi:DEAD/DEAH box helicase [Streptomyces thermolineatus]|uniref:DEAD/DEAH box helicase n=1 Tax=Streptomyces thermolineatus TaxID=44033 RepID=UPI00384E3D4A